MAKRSHDLGVWVMSLVNWYLTTLTGDNAAGRGIACRKLASTAPSSGAWRTSSAAAAGQPIPKPTDGYVVLLFHRNAPLCTERTTLTDIKKLRGACHVDNVSTRQPNYGAKVRG